MANTDWYQHIDLSGPLREALQFVAEGKTDQQIASQLAISLKTAKRHRKLLRRAFNSDSTAEMIAKATVLGFVNTDRIFANDKPPIYADYDP